MAVWKIATLLDATRMTTRLLTLLALLWVCGCSSEGPSAPTGPRVVFPDDESPHDTQVEWWYYSGRLTADADVYGFELAVFQPYFLGKYVYISHFAITDLQAQRFATDMQISGDDQRDAVPTGFSLHAGQAKIAGQGGEHTILGKMPDYELALTLKSQTPAILQYGSGWMTIGADEPFYYYSYPRMDAQGSLTVQGQKRSVSGRVWMDHQWGTIGGGYGWDWFSLRLDDGSDVMLFKVRKSGAEGFLGGTIIHVDGSTVALGPSDFKVTDGGEWVSPVTKIPYSHGWQVEIPQSKLAVTVTPQMADQEFVGGLGSPIYWEGLCEVEGTRDGAPITGHAYVEITGQVPALWQ